MQARNSYEMGRMRGRKEKMQERERKREEREAGMALGRQAAFSISESRGPKVSS